MASPVGHVAESTSASPSSDVAADPEQTHACEGHRILSSILAIEQRCLGSLDAGRKQTGTSNVGALNELLVECFLNEPDKKYFLCHSPSSPTVIAYFGLRLQDVHADEVHRAIVDLKERQIRDSDAEYRVHQTAREGDVTKQEAVSHVLHAPWPFADREMLQHRWQLPLDGVAGGLAIVLRSFEDADLFAGHPERVRATVHLSANLIRPFSADSADKAPGLDLAVCQQVDVGGLVPTWAQRLLSRFAVERGLDWGRKLKEHCVTMRRLRAEDSRALLSIDGDTARISGPKRPESLVPSVQAPKETLNAVEVLQEILEIEKRCSLASTHQSGVGPWNYSYDLDGDDNVDNVECLLDEPHAKYCLCCGLDSPVVVGFICVVLYDVYLDDVRSALLNREERLLRDPDSEYQVLREANEGDPHSEEDIAFVLRAPWPFWDRDVLQRRWILPLCDPGGIAVITRSFTDDALFPEHEERVRAYIHKCGYLLRPLAVDPGGAGVEVTVCQQVDLGGLCPDWAQEYITRWAVSHGLTWAEELRRHCRCRRAKAEGKENGLTENFENEDILDTWW